MGISGERVMKDPPIMDNPCDEQLMGDAGGIAVPEHLVPALLKWFKNPKPIYGTPVQ